MLQNDKISSLSPSMQGEVESWVVNSLKVKMIKKLDNLLEAEGRANARKIFLVPVFTVAELVKRVEEQAPEMRTLFYKELHSVLNESERKLLIL